VSSSSNVVNYSVRPNKTIERAIVFDALRRIIGVEGTDDCIYVGLGSAWFVDFEHAHRDLKIETMVSFEADEVTYLRAKFNRPYRTVEVIKGSSYNELPKLLDRESLAQKRWVVWLDYDGEMDASKLEELHRLVERIPPNSVLLTTFNAHPSTYGSPRQRRFDNLQDLFGPAFADELYPDGKGLVDTAEFQNAISKSMLSFLDSAARKSSRPGGFVPAFNLHYRDGSPMVTVGGVLPGADRYQDVRALTKSQSWRGFTSSPIVSPPLTAKEIAALRSLLPAETAPTRQDLLDLGFDLEDEHLASFVKYYLDYPVYVQAAR
jgi:hypothetical protein